MFSSRAILSGKSIAKQFLPLLAFPLLSHYVAAQSIPPIAGVDNTLMHRLDALASAVKSQFEILDTNSELLRHFGEASDINQSHSFVLHGGPSIGNATVIDSLLKQKHLDLWKNTSGSLHALSDTLESLSQKITNLSMNKQIVTLDQSDAPEPLRQLFSVSPTGEQLPVPPHVLLNPRYHASIGSYIVGPGSDAATIDYPSVAELDYADIASGGGRFSTQCTGILVSSDTVLTAAHCFCDFVSATDAASCASRTYQYGPNNIIHANNPSPFLLLFQDVGRVGISKITIDPGYKNKSADLALLTLKQRINSIRPAPITSVETVSPGSYAFIVGFGVRSTNNAGSPSIKSHSEGLKLWARVKLGTCPQTDVSNDHICWLYAPSQGDKTIGSTCHGDSGGPMFMQKDNAWLLVGTTAGGPEDCEPSNDQSTPSYDIDLSKNLQWLKSETSIASSAGSSDTLFIFDQSHRATGVAYKAFSEQQDQWTANFQLSSPTKMVRVIVNATPTVSHIDVALVPATGIKNKCAARSEDNYVSCTVPNPTVGKWQAVVSGVKPQETQLLTDVSN
jgi:secreted trypsin-like serine protease